jgi:hypothetical protein
MLNQPLEYEVVSRGKLKYLPYPNRVGRRGSPWSGMLEQAVDRPQSRIDPRIAEYVRRPEVSGRGEGGLPLVELREKALAESRQSGLADGLYDMPTRYDAEIAANIERHLHSTFSYTLDLTDTERAEGQDPMVAFLYDFKRGHCEYFAGAMTLMCQSLGIPARLVIGFKCDEFNGIGGYYVVQQNHAHAWVETRVGDSLENASWQTFDPTAAREASSTRALTLWTRVRHLFDFLEHTWANSVIAYDRSSRDSLVQNLENQLSSTAVSSSQKISNLPTWLKTENWAISSKLLTGLIALAVTALIGSIGWFLYERWRLWRRAERIGLDALPTEERLRLVRQLGFYDKLLQLLERRGHSRPRHLTPREFSNSLAFLPSEVFNAVSHLTEIFYRVRYGRHELSPGQRTRLDQTINEIEGQLGPATGRLTSSPQRPA